MEFWFHANSLPFILPKGMKLSEKQKFEILAFFTFSSYDGVAFEGLVGQEKSLKYFLASTGGGHFFSFKYAS